MPDAPAPRYNSRNLPVGEWLIVIRYDASRDVMTVSYTVDGTTHSASRQGATAFPALDVHEVMSNVNRLLLDVTTPRLF